MVSCRNECAMKTSKELLILLTVGVASVLAWGGGRGAAGPENETPLSEVSGVLHKNEKTIQSFLVLDGSDERCYVRGKALEKVERGAHIYVKGVLRSYLFDATGTDWKRPDAPAPPPFLKGWVICLDVKELKVIQEPFGEQSKESKNATENVAATNKIKITGANAGRPR